MKRPLLILGLLCVLVCGCKKKSSSSSPSSDPPITIPDFTPQKEESKTPQKQELKPIIAIRPTLPAGWVEFKHPEGAFTVYLPAQPRPLKVGAGTSLKQPLPTGRALLSEYKTEVPGLFCQMGVMIYSPELVDGVRNAQEQKPIGLNSTRATVTWAGQPASEIVSEDPENHSVRVERRMWIGNRSYYCNLWGMALGRPTAAERTAIFDSFTPNG
jgi:hypothetical protein